MNRGKHSIPSDVLLPSKTKGSARWIYCGVAQCLRNDVPNKIEYKAQKGRKEEIICTVDHDPEEDNYSHTELRVHKGGSRAKKISSRLAKKEYRTKLALKAVLLIKPCC